MLRSFTTHIIRPQTELSQLWEFTPLEGLLAGQTQKAPVPGCWEALPGLENYEGRAVYTTHFTGGGNLRLEFKGVSHNAKVLVDGKLLARHYGAYTPFEAVYPGLPEGGHELRVEVDNILNEESALHIPNDYYAYGGINRPVALEWVPGAYIRHVQATPVKNEGGWALEIAAEVYAIEAARDAQLCFAINGVGSITTTAQALAKNKTTRFTATLPCPDVVPHEPGKPSLYLLDTTLLLDGQRADDLIERVGFRTVRVEGERILWNGKPLCIRGFNRHEDHPAHGSALPFAEIARDIALMRDMGANAVRTSHYPNDELFLDLCDENGLLVWEENHARGLGEDAMRRPNFRAQALACIDEMVAAHYNHPCIFIWGILNECASDTEYGRLCYAEQFARLRELDKSRPVSFASCRFDNDICLDLVDVVSYNLYPGWYNNEPALEVIKNQHAWCKTHGGAGKPFLVTEIGAGAIPGCHSTTRVKWSEERQADILDAQLGAVLDYKEASGVFLWQFCDVRVHESWFFQRPRCMNNKGAVDEWRRPKLAYEVIKSHFSAAE